MYIQTHVLTMSHICNHTVVDDPYVRSTGSSTIGGYSVYSGMECESGDLVTVYEWILPCKSAATRTRRIKQVLKFYKFFNKLCLSTCLSLSQSVCLCLNLTLLLQVVCFIKLLTIMIYNSECFS